MPSIYDLGFNKRLYKEEEDIGGMTSSQSAIYNPITELLNPAQIGAGQFMGSQFIRTTTAKNRMIWNDTSTDRVIIGDISTDS